MPTSSEQLRRAWGCFATGVTVVTTLDTEGQVHGMTANALCSISLEPPLALLSVAHQRVTHGLIQQRQAFGLSILAQGQQKVAEYYAQMDKVTSPPEGARFWFTQRGTAVLHECLAYLDCQVVAQHQAEDHTLFIAHVEEAGLGQGKPLIFYQSAYARLQEN